MTFFAKHEVTGKISEYPDHYRDHPVLSKVLTEVDKPTQGCDDCSLSAEVDVYHGDAVLPDTPDNQGDKGTEWVDSDTDPDYLEGLDNGN